MAKSKLWRKLNHDMGIVELLRSIREPWLARCLQTIAPGANMREDFQKQLVEFFNKIIEAIETGDQTVIDPVLAMWSTSLTETDLEQGESSLIPFINQLVQITFKVCQETLPSDEAMMLTGTLLPISARISEVTTRFEIEHRVNYVTENLAKIQLSLEELERSKSDFIGVAAHELKTPLTLIEGYVSMLRDQLARRGVDPNDAILLDGIQSGAIRLKIIVNDMIDVSLIDNHILSLNFQPFWLNRIFTSLAEELQDSIKDRQQTLEILHFEGFADMNFGDPERLMQVFRNVLTNAIKYTPDHGKVTIRGRKLPAFLDVIISDTGIGISQENQAKIFEKFSRIGNVALHSSGKTKFKGGGPGLGLHIAKGIIEAHGGAIWVESSGCDENKFPGSIFHILLPVRDAPPDLRSAKAFTPLN